MSVYSFNFPTPVRFGAGAIAELPQALQDRGFRKPLLVTDSAVRDLPFFQDIQASLNRVDVSLAVYSDFSGNPIHSHVSKGREAFRNHNADCIVIVGGGAALDVGKAIALVAHNEGDLFEYEISLPNPREVSEPLPFIFAIPTTAGTGSEVGRASVISDDESHAKKILLHPKMLPSLVIADPELTVGLPPFVTATTGFDALTHNIEAFLAIGYQPLCDGIALEGIHLVSKYLVQACNEPRNLEARGGMLAASLMGAVAFQKGLGVTHSCAHALSTVYDMHHGLANAMMLRACMEFNGATEEQLMVRVANAAGIRGQDDRATCQAFYAWIDELRSACKVPLRLKELGVEALDDLVKVAQADFCHQENRRKVSEQDFFDLYRAAL